MSDYDEQQRENFIYYFSIVRTAPQELILARALRMADERPLRQTNRRHYDRFVSMAGYAQRELGGENLLLPQKQVAKLLGISGGTVSNMTHSAILDGYLTLVKSADVAEGLAAEYRFNIEKFPVLKERQ